MTARVPTRVPTVPTAATTPPRCLTETPPHAGYAAAGQRPRFRPCCAFARYRPDGGGQSRKGAWRWSE
jgi:hypothetical protein